MISNFVLYLIRAEIAFRWKEGGNNKTFGWLQIVPWNLEGMRD
jgi:hypothetical protein